jgi:hypothetical protein
MRWASASSVARRRSFAPRWLISCHRPPPEAGLVGLLLNLLARRGFERLLEIGVGPDRGDAHGHQLEPQPGHRVVAREAILDASADVVVARGQQLAHTGHRDVVERELLGELHQHPAQLLERLTQVATAGEIDAEVDALGQDAGLDDPIGQHALDRDILKVARAAVKQEAQLAIVDRDLDHAGIERSEPKRGSPTAAMQPSILVVDDMRARLRPQVTDEQEIIDVGHRQRLSRSLSVLSTLRIAVK